MPLLFALALLQGVAAGGFNHNPPGKTNYVLLYGQSLGTGYCNTWCTPVPDPCPTASGALAEMFTAASPYGVRLVPDSNDPTQVLSASAMTGISSLCEQVQNNSGSMAGTSDGETLATGIGYPLQSLSGGYRVLLSDHAVGAQCYTALKQGTTPYGNIKTAVARALQLAAPNQPVVRAIAVMHGECDYTSSTTQATYESDLLSWQQNLQSDLQAITGQQRAPLLFIDQVDSYDDTAWGTGSGCAPCGTCPCATSLIPGAQYNAFVHNPNTIFLVGPNYWIPHASDGVHLSPKGYEYEGEMFAKAINATLIQGNPWKPVYPTGITTDGANPAHITLTYNVPVAPLVLDTTIVTPPNAASVGCGAGTTPYCYGFEYTDNSTPPTISSVALQGSNQVVLTMSGAITATSGNRTVRYAWTAPTSSGGGPSNGPRGNLRDSDPALSRLGDGTHLYNWAVAGSWSF